MVPDRSFLLKGALISGDFRTPWLEGRIPVARLTVCFLAPNIFIKSGDRDAQPLFEPFWCRQVGRFRPVLSDSACDQDKGALFSLCWGARTKSSSRTGNRASGLCTRIPNERLPIQDSQWKTHNGRLPMKDSQWKTPNGRFPIEDSQ